MKLTRFRRRLGTVLLLGGLLFLAYGAVVYFWRDPATDLYTRWKQHQLADDLEEVFAAYRSTSGTAPAAEAAPDEAQPGETEPEAPVESVPLGEPAEDGDSLAAALEVKEAATRYLKRLDLGDPLGRIIVPKLGIDPVFVNGTRWGADLTRGPGRYPETWLPGIGKVTAIAGHRTTFAAPFRRIDRLEAGDEIRLELAYGSFYYQVVGHEIVDDEDWSIIRPRGYDALVLSACHPLYSAAQRWIVYARLVRVDLPDGASYLFNEESELVAAPRG